MRLPLPERSFESELPTNDAIESCRRAPDWAGSALGRWSPPFCFSVQPVDGASTLPHDDASSAETPLSTPPRSPAIEAERRRIRHGLAAIGVAILLAIGLWPRRDPVTAPLPLVTGHTVRVLGTGTPIGPTERALLVRTAPGRGADSAAIAALAHGVVEALAPQLETRPESVLVVQAEVPRLRLGMLRLTRNHHHRFVREKGVWRARPYPVQSR